MNSITPALAELERAYDLLARRFPAGGIPGVRPVIVVQAGRERRLLGWHLSCAWHNGQEKPIHEITICAEHLARRPEEVIETLLHEMVHHCNAMRGVRDCSASQYHNRMFRDLARQVGLQVEKMGWYGWADTKLGPAALEAVRSLNPNAAAFTLSRRNDQSSKAPTKMLKWSCGCTNLRCATTLEAVCKCCGCEFVRT